MSPSPCWGSRSRKNRSWNPSTNGPLVGAMHRAAPVVKENLVLILVELEKQYDFHFML